MSRDVAIEVDWSRQKRDFEADGSLRDVYVLGATAVEWAKVLVFLSSGPFDAEFSREDVAAAVPLRFEQAGQNGLLRFRIGPVAMACHFFSVDEIEFDLQPSQVDEEALRQLLGFVVDVGSLTGKVVVLTPENLRDSPIFRYTPGGAMVEWLPE